ncbi:MAG TPA: hypothetical protein VFS43_45870 [Polyangiaceae bacterium]|nr:hypothetical protein [Polyangiaceae bacterium]
MRHSSFLLALLVAGCSATPPLDAASGGPDYEGNGGAAGSGVGGSGGAGAGGLYAPDWGSPAAPSGSFDVRLLEVLPVESSGPKVDRSPSDGVLLRIDFPSDCGGDLGTESEINPVPCVLRLGFEGKVLVTAQGGVSAAYDVVRSENALILKTEGSRVLLEDAVEANGGAGGGTGQTYFASDRWSKFTFPLDARGQVVPPVLAEAGQTITTSDGLQIPVNLNGRASFHADRTAPQAELVVGSSFSPPGAQLPWDPVTVRFDEPIRVEPLSAIFATPEGQPAPSSLVWRWGVGEAAAPLPLVEAFGATWYRGYWRGWDTAPAASTVRLGPFRDSRGNSGEGFERPVTVFAPPANPSALIDFDTLADGDKVVLWGDAALVDDGCEAGRCLTFSFENVECGLAETSGFALRLRAPAGVDPSELQLEARVRVDAEGAGGGGAPSGELKAFSAQLLWAGSEEPQYDQPLAPPPKGWGSVTTPLKPPVAPPPPATPPPNEGDLAVVIRSGGRYATEPCRKSAPAPVPTRVTIDSVAITLKLARDASP